MAQSRRALEWLGVLAGNTTAFVLIGITWLLVQNGSDATVFVYSEFVLVPMLMGIASAWVWRDLELNTRQTVGLCFLNGSIAILLSAAFLREGAICLVIASPLLFAFIISGTFLGKAMFKKRNDRLNISILAAILLAFIIDSRSEHTYQNMVSDVMVVNAPVSKVWKNVVAYDRIKQEPDYWLFKIGMPNPVQSTAEGYHLGAKRKCIFSNGYVFDEVITKYEENRNLVFDITEQPRDPEIMGHIDILRGQFILKDNGNGTTTVTGNSSYKLYVFPTWYYDIWARSVVRNVHLRVMDHIKQISENN